MSIIQRILKTTAHNAFPVVRIIEREHLDASGVSFNLSDYIEDLT